MKRADLEKIRILDMELALKKLDLKQHRERHMGIQGVSYDTIRVQKSVDNAMERYIVRAEELEEIITETEQALYDQKRELDKRLRKLDFKYYMILRLRYLNLLEWHQVADEAGLSEAHVFRLHGEALKRIDEL